MADKNGRLFVAGFTGVANTDIAGFTGKTLTSAEQTLITGLISSIETTIARQCGRNFLDLGNTDSYYETFDADYQKYYPFSYPLKEIRKIEIDGVAVYTKGGNNNALTLGRDLFCYPSYVLIDPPRQSSVDNRQALKIYYAIENVVGDDMKLAVKQFVSDIFLNRENAGKSVSSVNVAGVSLSFDPNSLPNYIKTVIATYKKPRI